MGSSCSKNDGTTTPVDRLPMAISSDTATCEVAPKTTSPAAKNILEKNDPVHHILSFLISEENFLNPRNDGKEAWHLLAVSKKVRQAFLQALRPIDFKFRYFSCRGADQVLVLRWAKRHNLKIAHLRASVSSDHLYQAMEVFTETEIWSNLVSLGFYPCEAVEAHLLCPLFAQATRLEKLELWTEEEGDPYDTYRDLTTLESLKSLRIHDHRILQDVLSDIEHSRPSSLETLDLGGCAGHGPVSITSKTLKVLIFNCGRGEPIVRLNCPSLELIFTHPRTFSTIGGTQTEKILANATPATDEESERVRELVLRGTWPWYVRHMYSLPIVTIPFSEAALQQPDAIRVGTNCRIVAFVGLE